MHSMDQRRRQEQSEPLKPSALYHNYTTIQRSALGIRAWAGSLALGLDALVFEDESIWMDAILGDGRSLTAPQRSLSDYRT